MRMREMEVSLTGYDIESLAGGPMDNSKEPRSSLSVPRELPIVPTVDVVVFPQMVVPLLVLDDKIISGIARASDGDKHVLIVATQERQDGYNGPVGTQDLYGVGTVSRIMRAVSLSDGSVKILVQGLVRAKVEEVLTDGDELSAVLKEYEFDSGEGDPEKIEEKVKEIILLSEAAESSDRNFGRDFQMIISQIQNPERLIDFLTSHMSIGVGKSQEMLEMKSVFNLLDEVYGLLKSEIELSSVQEKVITSARDSINQTQREYFLKEQLKAIQKELGECDESESGDLRRKLETVKLSAEAREEAVRQLRRLDQTSPDSLEATVIRNHLECLFSLPWETHTKDDHDLKHAKSILDDEHFGLEKVKDRILDSLSVRVFQSEYNAPLLCLSGPPGVGKTSLGRSIANCLGRKFVRISLGGVHDESEIRGHRRTYVGAMPGRIIQSMKKAGTCNPVIMIDEVDKLGSSNRGDPSAALLEVLDPEQNGTFYDNYLGVPFDLSKVMFIATCNDLSAVPEALSDRMEVIKLSGYSSEEKVEIAKRHLVVKSIKNAGLSGKGITLSSSVIKEVIDGYTREAGVRELERYVGKLCSKFARALVEGSKVVSFTAKNVHKYLGPRKVRPDGSCNGHRIGVTNGLAWTQYGGEILQVEAILMPGRGKLLLTGQLGDVMKESAQAAMSYIRSHAKEFDIKDESFEKFDLHVHFPAGAIPKDGPSAGVTLISSILSVFTGRPVDSSCAMTGEINLQGLVLPIGGLKEKILAAKRYGLKTVIIPEQNRCDADEITENVEGVDFVFVDCVAQMLKKVLMPVI
jgi:ATP-dependent Lon protease